MPSHPRSLTSRVTLSDGNRMPVLGLGVWQARGDDAYYAVCEALRSGYRHIDTATFYGNEREVGRAIHDSGIPRKEIFVTTKLWITDFLDPAKALRTSLSKLGLSYVDLYLLHWPVPALRERAWDELVRLKTRGLARSIGVSNFAVPHLQALARHSRVLPAVNQIELTPFCQTPGLVEYCRKHGIAVEAYSPLAQGKHFSDPVIQAVASQVGRSAAQVMIRWGLQRGFIEIPKSVTPLRIRENARVFDFSLSPAQMKALNALERNEHRLYDPAGFP